MDFDRDGLRRGCAIGLIIVAAVASRSTAGEIGERVGLSYSSFRSIFQSMPREFLPHKITNETNPVLRNRAEEWAKQNIIGSSLTLKNVDLLSINSTPRRISITVSTDPGFMMGAMKYLVPGDFDRKKKAYNDRGPIICVLWESWRDRPRTVKPDDAGIVQENAVRDSINDRLIKLKTLRKAKNGRITQRPSKVTVRGAITSFTASLDTRGKRPCVLVRMYSLGNAEFKK